MVGDCWEWRFWGGEWRRVDWDRCVKTSHFICLEDLAYYIHSNFGLLVLKKLYRSTQFDYSCSVSLKKQIVPNSPLLFIEHRNKFANLFVSCFRFIWQSNSSRPKQSNPIKMMTTDAIQPYLTNIQKPYYLSQNKTPHFSIFHTKGIEMSISRGHSLQHLVNTSIHPIHLMYIHLCVSYQFYLAFEVITGSCNII